MARSGDRAHPQVTRDERLSIVDPYIDVGRDARAVHDTGYAEPSRELARRREVIRVRVRVDDVSGLDLLDHFVYIGERGSLEKAEEFLKAVERAFELLAGIQARARRAT